MHVLMTGGTGLIGAALCQRLAASGAKLTVLTRDIQKAKHLVPIDGIHFIEQLSEIKPDAVFDAVVNLAGAPIAKPWTKRYKNEIKKSRIALTKSLVSLLKTLNTKPSVLVSGSAIGLYGPQEDDAELIETSPSVESFSHDVCQEWEQAANRAEEFGMRVVNLRTGVVLSKKGGALAKMRLPFKLGLGGPISNGQQWMSWVHLDDIVSIILFCIENNIDGPVNATAPNPVTNKTFADTYAKVLHRPAFLPMPAWFLKLVMGEMAQELLICGQRVVPEKLEQAGFKFAHPELEEALLALHSR